ncbi:MAG: hypothetical protein WCF45_17825 [Photobacterium halotolerans]
MNTYFVMKNGHQYSASEKVSDDELNLQFAACKAASVTLVSDTVVAESEEKAIRQVKSIAYQTTVIALVGFINTLCMLFVAETAVNLVIMMVAILFMVGVSGKARDLESEALKALRKAST